MDLTTILDITFSSSSYKGPFDVDTAFSRLDKYLKSSDWTIESLTAAIVKHQQGVLELLLTSRTRDTISERIREFLLKPWPVSRSALPQPQLDVLQRLSQLVTSLPPALLLPPDIVAGQKCVGAISEVLAVLIQFDHGRNSSNKQKKKAGRAPQSKTPKRTASDPEVASEVYEKAGFTQPQSQGEADRLIERLLSECRTMLQAYLEYGRSADISKYVRKAFIMAARTGSSFTVPDPQDLPDMDEFSSGEAFGGRTGPERALLYLRDGAEAEKWPVVLAKRALKQLRHFAHRDTTVFKVVQRRVMELREGFFPSKNQKQFLGNEYGIPLYAAELGEDLSLIYQIDAGGPAPDPSYESQYIRVYDIAKIDKSFWSSVAAQLNRKDTEYRARCNERSLPRIKAKGINVIPPVVRLRDSAQYFIVDDTPEQGPLGEKLSLDLHRILALEKFIPYSRELFEAVRSDSEGTFMFAMSSPERDIIKHNSSCLVLGRSGTGKTTTMMFKMLAYELAAQQAGTPYRQMFITRSPALAEKVKAYYAKLKTSSLEIDDDENAEPSSVLPALTLEDLSSGRRSADNPLPERFSDLQDDHFPLFLAFEELCGLLAADLELHFDPEMPSTRSFRPRPSAVPDYRQGLITFKFFKAEIWPHITSKGLDPMLVFSEFMGVIKGTERTLDTPSGYLDRQSYEGLSTRTQPMFAHQRPQIYDLFEAYLKSRPHRAYDVPDRTHALLEAMKKRVPGTQVDFVYVDEAQDNLLVDTALLRTLCRNPHGLFYAGDTAQTISEGSSFRFNDLKAFLYRLERREPLVLKGKRPAVDPAFFDLSVNYRSHEGIIKAAAFIVSLLGRFFPNSVDHLAGERALVSGPRPIFFMNRAGETPFGSIISGDSQQQIEFGSDQVIIVRDEASRQRLLQRIGDHAGMVMTLYMSKGQEFNDVLLYDFFADSSASAADWRSLLNAAAESSRPSAAAVDAFERKHAVLQSELKCMYVGLTRARERVWFWDTGDRGDSWKSLMIKHNLATAIEPHQSVPNLAVRSTAREWTARARECFLREDYANASLGFENAGQGWGKSVSEAYGLRQSAESLPSDNPVRKTRFSKSAILFSRCAKQASSSTDRKKLLISAARCHSEADEYRAAAEMFLTVDLYNDAVHHYRLAGRFDEAISVINDHRPQLDQQLIETVEDVAVVVYTRRGETKKARKLFKSNDAHLEFLEDHGFEAQHITTLQDLALHDKAADVFHQKKEYAAAASQFLLSKVPGSAQRAAACLLEGLEARMSYGTEYGGADPITRELLTLTARVPLTRDQSQELETFRALQDADSIALARLARRSMATKPHLALLCLDGWSNLNKETPLGPRPTRIQEVIDTLSEYLQYGRLVHSTAHSQTLLEHAQYRWVFGLQTQDLIPGSAAADNPAVATNVLVSPHSFIYRATCDEAARGLGMRLDTGEVLLPQQNAADLIRRSLISRLNAMLMPLLGAASYARYRAPFDICIHYIATSRCNSSNCARTHLEPADVSVEQFNRHVYLHLLIIAVLDHFSIDKTDRREENSRKSRQGMWIMRLFETCYPATTKLGSVSDIMPDLIPEYNALMSVAKTWAQELFCNQKERHPFFLTNVIACAMLGTTLDYQNAIHYLPRGQWGMVSYKSQHHLAVESGLGWFSRQARDRGGHGVHFIDQAIKQKMPIDVGVLISFIECVSLQLIINHGRHELVRYNGMVLPRSWMIRAFQQGPSDLRNGDSPFELLYALGRLLKILGSGDGGDRELNFRRTSLFNTHRETRSIAMARVCRVIALLGHNLGQTWLDLRRIIVQIFQGLCLEDRFLHPMYKGYYTATTWDAVSGVMSLSVLYSSLDEMVAILNQPGPQSSYRIPGIRNIRWTDEVDLMRKLLLDTHVPAIIPFLVAVTGPTDRTREPSSQAPEKGTRAPDHEGFHHIERSDAEESAARQIQVSFRRHQKRMRGGAGGPLFEAFNALSPAANTLEMRHYFLHLRGVMPRVLAYTEKMLSLCRLAKKELNGQMVKAAHQSLDDIRCKGKEVRILTGNIKSLVTRLGPKSSMHNRGSLQALRQQVQMILDLKDRTAAFCPQINDYDIDYEDGVLFILRDRKVDDKQDQEAHVI